MVTLNKIAREAGVSAGVVSRVVNHKAAKNRISPVTEKRVMEIARKHNYQPNFLGRGLRSGKTGLVGVIMATAQKGHQGIIFQGIQHYLDEHDYGIVTCASEYQSEREQRGLDFVLSRKVEGIILISTLNWNKEARDYVCELERRQVKIVCMGVNLHPEVTSPFIGHDEQMAGYLATKHLLKSGRKKIVCLTDTFNYNTINILRIAGYKKALKEQGVSVVDSLIFDNNDVVRPVLLDWVHQTMTGFFKSGKTCDGVFADCDSAAVGTVKAIKSCGLKVPEDIAVVGTNNEEYAEYVNPTLTSVALDDYLLGQELAKALCKKLKGEKVASKLLKPKLIIRESSGKAAFAKVMATEGGAPMKH